MANHKSAKKRARQDIVRNQRNKGYLRHMRSVVKSVRQAGEAIIKGEGDVQTASSLLKQAQSLLERAAQKGLIHRNNASRNVTRLTKMVVKAEKGELQVASTTSRRKKTQVRKRK
ncbi:MAG: 30S ribosomal protein S20 [Oligoflexales bacterium]